MTPTEPNIYERIKAVAERALADNQAILTEYYTGNTIPSVISASMIHVFKRSTVDLECLILMADAELEKQAAQADTSAVDPVATRLCRDCAHAIKIIELPHVTEWFRCARFLDPVYGEPVSCAGLRGSGPGSAVVSADPRITGDAQYCNLGEFWEPADSVATTTEE